MGFTILGSAEPKYLAASDVLIGDMSNINYEFLLFDRPVILLANDWVTRHFPEIGIKTNLEGLANAIHRSLNNPSEFGDHRKFWVDQTMFLPEGGANKFCIDLSIERSGFLNPDFVLIDGNNAVRKTNLQPLIAQIQQRHLSVELIHKYIPGNSYRKETIFIGAHFNDIKKIEQGYTVHIDHDLKGPSTANIAKAKRDYKRNGYFENIHLHIAAGKAGKIRTQYLLAKNHERVVIGGYPKADDYLNCNTSQNKLDVCTELGLDPSKPLVTYAPAGVKKYMKPGGSYTKTVLKHLESISEQGEVNVLVKVKYSRTRSIKELGLKVLKYMYSEVMKIAYPDGGKEWDAIIEQIEAQGKTTTSQN